MCVCGRERVLAYQKFPVVSCAYIARAGGADETRTDGRSAGDSYYIYVCIACALVWRIFPAIMRLCWRVLACRACAIVYMYIDIDIVCSACAVSACGVLVLSVRSACRSAVGFRLLSCLCRSCCVVRCYLLLYGVLVLQCAVIAFPCSVV